MEKSKIFSIYFALFLLGSMNRVLAAPEYDVDAAIRQLDKTVQQRDLVYGERLEQIDSIKDCISNVSVSPRQILLNYERIGDEYAHFNNDSTLKFYGGGLRRSFECEDDSMQKVFNLKLASYFPMAGHVGYATRHYEFVDTAGMSTDLKKLYYETGRRMYYLMSILNEPQSIDYKQNVAKIIECQRHLLDLTPDSSVQHRIYQGEYYFQTKDYDQAWTQLLDALEECEPNSRTYATTADMIARIAAQRGDHEAEKYYLAIAADADIKSFKREVSSLQSLAARLFNEGDVDRAYNYMLVALENATKCRSVARMMQISPQLPLITEASNHLRAWWTRTYTIIISIMIICIIAVVIFAWILIIQLKRMHAMQTKLVEANNLKNVYMSQFLVLCSIFMDKLNQFSSLVNRKIGSGQTDELYRMTKSGAFIEEQTTEFYQVFDDAFLHIYPDFVEQVNNLFEPSERIVLKSGERLNNDLRILACMRLGIDDASRIGQILNYSVNTIYAYRRRLRGKAINRDTFESDIMNLS